MRLVDLDLVPALDTAVADHSFLLHYQPEVDLASGAVLGMEALLRWKHPGRGLLWPSEFLSVVADRGLLGQVGAWVLDEAVAELVAWRELPQPPSGVRRQLWVNVPAAQLADPGFADSVARRLGDAGIGAGLLGIEVTEEALAQLADPPAVLRELRRAGAALAVDDFGTWYSSLATLEELPVDAIKLDAKFVRGVGLDLDDDSIVASIIRLAHARDLYVVAEGVESWAEGARLCELGCDRAYGYLFSAPQRAEKARSLLARGAGWTGSYLGEAHGLRPPFARVPQQPAGPRRRLSRRLGPVMRAGALAVLKGHGTENDFVLVPDVEGLLDLSPTRGGAALRPARRPRRRRRAPGGADRRGARGGAPGRRPRRRRALVHGLPQRRRLGRGDVRQRPAGLRPVPRRRR